MSRRAVWLGTGWLEEFAERLADYDGLPAVGKGAVVVAVGSSFSDASVVFTGLAGVTHVAEA